MYFDYNIVHDDQQARIGLPSLCSTCGYMRVKAASAMCGTELHGPCISAWPGSA